MLDLPLHLSLALALSRRKFCDDWDSGQLLASGFSTKMQVAIVVPKKRPGGSWMTAST